MLLDAFLTYIRCELNLSVHTVLSYGSDIRQWYAFADSVGMAGANAGSADFEPDPAAVDVNDIRLWVSHLASESVAARSIRRKLQSLRAFYKYLMRRHGLKVNPAAEIASARLPKRLPSFIRSEQLNEIIDDAYNPQEFDSVRNHLIIDMFYSTGMRCSELIGLRDDDINTIKCELKVLGKRNKERIIPFGNEMSALIQQYRAIRDATVHGTDAPNFFVRSNGQPLYRRLAYKIVNDALLGRVSSSKCSPHVLRHSFASDMLNNGADITAVQQLLGHQSLATTQIYTHLSYRELLTNYKHAHPRAQKS